MDQAHIDQGMAHPSLGPNYFAAREAAEKIMDNFQTGPFEKVIKKAADDIYSAVLESFENFLLSDAEHNVQGIIWRQIDESVKALLSGEKWALERYALQGRYECEKIREAVAKHIPAELQDLRVKELEEEVERLKKDIEWRRGQW